MKSDLRLFIGNNEVELTDNPSILYSYSVDETTSPTAVKNSFTKTITIQGTPNNNRIFGEYWSVERRVGNNGQNAGVDFNASKKAPFQVFVNGEMMESGFVKMEKINIINDIITYDISLYGGLSDYFYSLTYSNETGEKKKLSDLNYTGGGDSEFDFTASASTVYEAWNDLKNGTDSKWQHINFMPAYNGYPSDFDSDKVVIGLAGTNLPQSAGNGLFQPRDGFVIANLPQKMTEWEMRDLRSYLQRPCIRMKSIIDACCDPDQNGGYTVDLDPDFFSDGNDYLSKTWLSLPLLKNLEYSSQEQTLDGASLIGVTSTGSTSGMMYQDLRFDIGEFGSTNPSTIELVSNMYVTNSLSGINIDIIPELNNLFRDWTTPSTSFAYFWRQNGDSYHPKWWCLGSLFVQLIALNGDVVVGASDAFNLTTPIRHNGKLYYGHNGIYSKENQFVPYLEKNIQTVLGTFERDGFYAYGHNAPYDFHFYIRGLNGPVSQLKMVYFFGATDEKINQYGQKATFFEYEQANSWIVLDEKKPGRRSFGDASPLTAGIKSTNIQAVLGESLGRTGTKVTKSLLLNTEGSPADYLLSFCKMFGLYFVKEIENPVIHIMTRKTYYKRNEIVNLEDYIDRGKDTKINPLIFDTKWYEMVQGMDETDFYSKYKSSRGIEYGCKLLNTGFEFNVEKKNLYSGSTIKSGIEGLERSKYFSAFNDDNRERSWMGMGLHYTLYFGNETTEVDVPIKNNSDLLGLNEAEGMKYYDITPKLQFHRSENEPTDGNDCLVFFSGFKSVVSGRSNPITYYLSDDNAWQTIFNDGTPCWFFTTSDYVGTKRVAYTLTELPVFERYLTNENSGKVEKSLDFGTPQELFIPSYNIEERSNIYSNFWRSYIEDLFDPNTRSLTCYVVANGKVGTDWLRRFYWFDNAIWRLERVSDHDLASFGSTQMEFIKVQDVNNYTSITQSEDTRISLTADKYRIDEGGDTVVFTVSVTNGASWVVSVPTGVVVSRSSGTGDGTFTATFPANNEDYVKGWYFTVSTEDNAQARATITQDYFGMTDFTVVPEDIIVPGSGGTVFVSFIWKNQGDDFINNIDLNEGEDYLQFSVDLNTYMGENMAALYFDPNPGNTTLHNYCQFQSYNGISRSIGIDQLPAEYSFEPSGGTQSTTLNYSPRARFTNVPDWATITETSDGVYDITVKENLYASDNGAVVTVTNEDGVSADFVITQTNDGGVQPSGSDGGVSPLNLYYDVNGGTQFVSIGFNQPWSASVSGAFITLSSYNGDGRSTIGVVVPANADNSGRNGTITITNLDTNAVYTISVTQDGGTTTKSLSVTPASTQVPSGGGQYTLNILYNGRNGDYLTVSGSSSALTWTPISWTGESGTTVVTVAGNGGVSGRTVTLSFSGNGVSASSSFVQAGTSADGKADDNSIVVPSGGDDYDNGVDSNVPWYAVASDNWIGVAPSSGNEGHTNIVITTQDNTGLTDRTGYVYIYNANDDTLLDTITVRQGGMVETLSVTPSTIYFDSTGGVATFTITSNTDWTIV